MNIFEAVQSLRPLAAAGAYPSHPQQPSAGEAVALIHQEARRIASLCGYDVSAYRWDGTEPNGFRLPIPEEAKCYVFASTLADDLEGLPLMEAAASLATWADGWCSVPPGPGAHPRADEMLALWERGEYRAMLTLAAAIEASAPADLGGLGGDRRLTPPEELA